MTRSRGCDLGRIRVRRPLPARPRRPDVRRRGLRPRPRLPGREQPARRRGPCSPSSPASRARPAQPRPGAACGVGKVTVDGRRPPRVRAPRRQAARPAGRAGHCTGERAHRSTIQYAGHAAARCAAPWGERRLGGALRRRDRRRPARRCAVLVPVQRPARRQGDATASRSPPSRRTPSSPTAGWSTSGSGASRTTWVFEQPEPMATYLATVQIGRYDDAPARRGRRCRSTVVVPRRGPTAAAHDFGRQPQMIDVFAGAVRAVPVRRLHRRRDRRRPGDPARGAGRVDLRRQPRRRPSGAAERLVAHELAHQWFGNSLTVGRWQDIWLHEGFACYAEWLWSEQRRRRDRPTQHAREASARGWPRLPQDLVLGRPRAGPDVRRPALQARRADPARAARSRSATRRSSTGCATGSPSHRFGTVTTALLTDEVSRSGRGHRAAAPVALAARAAGPARLAGAAGTGRLNSQRRHRTEPTSAPPPPPSSPARPPGRAPRRPVRPTAESTARGSTRQAAAARLEPGLLADPGRCPRPQPFGSGQRLDGAGLAQRSGPPRRSRRSRPPRSGSTSTPTGRPRAAATSTRSPHGPG